MSERGIWKTSLGCTRRSWLLPNQLRLTLSFPLQICVFFPFWDYCFLYNPTFQRSYAWALLSLDSPKLGYITESASTTTTTKVWFKTRVILVLTQKSAQAWAPWPLVLLLLMCLWVHPNFSHLVMETELGSPPEKEKFLPVLTLSKWQQFSFLTSWLSGSQWDEIWCYLVSQRGSIITESILLLLVKSKRPILSALSKAALGL